MPNELDRLKGYVPTEQELLDDFGVKDVSDLGEVLLLRCRELKELAISRNKIEKYGTPYDFIVCHSDAFFRTFVEMGFGTPSLVIVDDEKGICYFFMFEDKVPKKFRGIVAMHEATEYELVFNEGLNQRDAHLESSRMELRVANELGLKDEYLRFVSSGYPQKYDELTSLTLEISS